VSRSVARLEDDLGVRLLQRTTRRLSLTDAGQSFFERVRGAANEVEEAAAAVAELGAEPRGIVRMTAPSGAHSLSQALALFTEKYPKIHVELSLASRAVDLVAEGFDLAIRAGRLEDSTLVARRISAADIALFAAPRYLADRGRPAALVDLTEHDCLLFKARGGRSKWTLTGPHGEESVEVRGKVSADEMEFVADLSAEGLGVALLPIVLVGEYVQDGRLEHVLAEYRMTGGSVSAVLPSSAFVPSRVALLRDFLVDFLRREYDRWNDQCTAHRKKSSPTVTKRKRSKSRTVRPAASAAPSSHRL
jgi:DNA-binding transcriptional LysR family regulator